ncbi:MAG: LEPR-XLL domain-containing protein, partial [Burkholderiales bacterium]
MFGWFKNRKSSQSPDEKSGEAASGDHAVAAQSRFRLEPLEPRVLLSGDGMLGAVMAAKIVETSSDKSASAIVEELDRDSTGASSELIFRGAALSSGGDSPGVEWPEDWKSATAGGSTGSGSGSLVEDSEALVLAVDEAVPTAADLAEIADDGLTSRAAELAASPDASGRALDTNSALVTSLFEISPPATGPPADHAGISAALTQEVIQNSNLDSIDASTGSDDGFFALQFLRVAEGTFDAQPRAPPVERALTEADVAGLLERVIAAWSASQVGDRAASVLAGLTIRIADLPGGQVGSAESTTITLDPTAAGRGWFVDPTPEDDSEFVAGDDVFRIAANPFGPAHGRVDLFTVLLHETGHVLGFGHDSGMAIMSEALPEGERIRVAARDAATGDAAAGAPVTDAARTGDTLDLLVSTIAGGTLNN